MQTLNIGGPATSRVEKTGQIFHHYIVGEIGAAEDYMELLADLAQASPEDVIYLHLNTPGGDLMTCCQIIHAIEECRAPVVTSAEGTVASGGSLLFFSGTGFIVGDLSTFLLHDGSGGVYGKVNENLKAAKASTEHLKRVYEHAYGRFFTKKEIKKILKGGDMYLKPKDVIKRLEKSIKEEEIADRPE